MNPPKTYRIYQRRDCSWDPVKVQIVKCRRQPEPAPFANSPWPAIVELGQFIQELERPYREAQALRLREQIVKKKIRLSMATWEHCCLYLFLQKSLHDQTISFSQLVETAICEFLDSTDPDKLLPTLPREPNPLAHLLLESRKTLRDLERPKAPRKKVR